MRSVTTMLAGIGAVLLVAVAVLLVLLAVLPGREPFLADTISATAYGAHGRLAFSALLLFGLATAAFATSLGLRLGGGAGTVCGLLVGVWAVAAVFDAFVRSSSAHVGTVYRQPHTMLAVAGIVAQMLVALVYLGVAHRRFGRIPARLQVVTALVLAGGVLVAVHPDSLAGLSERVLIAASALWMLTSVQVAKTRLPEAGLAVTPGEAAARRAAAAGCVDSHRQGPRGRARG